MNNQFATQFLREDSEELKSTVSEALEDTGIDEYLVKRLTDAVLAGHITLEKALEIIRDTKLDEDGGAAAAAPAGGGGSTTGGGVTNGAGVSGGSEGEQYFAGTKKKKKYQEDAPRLAGSPAKTNKQGTKNLTAYKNFGFTKAPNAEEAGKKIKGVQVKMLWKEGEVPTWEIVEPLVRAIADRNVPRNLHAEFFDHIKDGLKKNLIKKPQDIFNSASNFLELYREGINESRAYSQFKKQTAIRPKDQQMHEAVKMIHKKLEEVSKLVEFAKQMRNELSEGENTLEYKHNTKKIFEKINSKVVEVYTKTRELK